MNIEGANLSALLPNHVGGTVKTSEGKAGHKDFADAFKEQVTVTKNSATEAGFRKHNENKPLKSNEAARSTGSRENKLDDSDIHNLLNIDLSESINTNAPDLETTLALLTDAAISIMPAADPAKLDAPQDSSNLPALNGQTFFENSSEETATSDFDESVSTDKALPKASVLFQSLRQGLNLQPSEDAEMPENVEGLEKTVLSGTESATQAIAPAIKAVDNKPEFFVLKQPINHPGWSKDLSEQIVWMNNKALSAAEITMNPPHLGSISVRIDMNQDQATIQFTAQQAAVREALEASIPKLRDMLGEQQINLVNVNISHDAGGHQRSQDPAPSSAGDNAQGSEKITDEAGQDDKQALIIKGLLSIYA